MAANKLTARQLRKLIGDLGFDYGVSLHKRAGIFWISPIIGTDQRRTAIHERLVDCGIIPLGYGIPGTAGEHAVSVLLNDEGDLPALTPSVACTQKFLNAAYIESFAA